MDSSKSPVKGYLYTAIVGAVGGGLLALFTTRAIPKMTSQMMSNMMSRMKEGSGNPEEM
jgi:hypothetical protein